MKLTRSLLKFIVMTFLLTLISSSVHGDCEVYTFSSDNNPVQYATITITNLTDGTSIYSNTTNSSGGIRHEGGCENISISATYPSTNYSALHQNISVDSEVHINDFITARVQVVNTLGSFLEAQDCSVITYLANTTDLIHDYDTYCKADEPFIDRNGNWVSVSDCKLTDSRGWYYFKGKIDENMGYNYNTYYDLVFTCNGISSTVTFITELERQPDLDKLEDYVQKNGGILLIYGFFGFIGLIFILVTLLIVINLAQSKTKG